IGRKNATLMNGTSIPTNKPATIATSRPMTIGMTAQPTQRVRPVLPARRSPANQTKKMSGRTRSTSWPRTLKARYVRPWMWTTSLMPWSRKIPPKAPPATAPITDTQRGRPKSKTADANSRKPIPTEKWMAVSAADSPKTLFARIASGSARRVTAAAARPRAERMLEVLSGIADRPEIRLSRGSLRRNSTASGRARDDRQGRPSIDCRVRPDDRDAGRRDSDAINRRSPEPETQMDALSLLMLAIAILLTLDVVAAQLR